MSDTSTTKGLNSEPPLADTRLDHDGNLTHAWSSYFQDTSDRLNGMLARARRGVVDGSEAAAGDIGEYLQASGGSVGMASASLVTIATLDLTAGDWDVVGEVHIDAGSAGAGAHQSFGAGLDGALNVLIVANFPTGAIGQILPAGPRRYNVTGATAVLLRAWAQFTGGTVSASGSIWARRVR